MFGSRLRKLEVAHRLFLGAKLLQPVVVPLDCEQSVQFFSSNLTVYQTCEVVCAACAYISFLWRPCSGPFQKEKKLSISGPMVIEVVYIWSSNLTRFIQIRYILLKFCLVVIIYSYKITLYVILSIFVLLALILHVYRYVLMVCLLDMCLVEILA